MICLGIKDHLRPVGKPALLFLSTQNFLLQLSRGTFLYNFCCIIPMTSSNHRINTSIFKSVQIRKILSFSLSTIYLSDINFLFFLIDVSKNNFTEALLFSSILIFVELKNLQVQKKIFSFDFLVLIPFN